MYPNALSAIATDKEIEADIEEFVKRLPLKKIIRQMCQLIAGMIIYQCIPQYPVLNKALLNIEIGRYKAEAILYIPFGARQSYEVWGSVHQLHPATYTR